MKLSDEERATLEELLADRSKWFADQVRADIAADDIDDTLRAGLTTFELIRLEIALGIM